MLIYYNLIMQIKIQVSHEYSMLCRKVIIHCTYCGLDVYMFVMQFVQSVAYLNRIFQVY